MFSLARVGLVAVEGDRVDKDVGCGGQVLAFLAALAFAVPVAARDYLDTERDLADAMIEPAEGEVPEDIDQDGEDEVDTDEGPAPKEGDEGTKSRWAILPQLGYSPSKGPNAGVKFVSRDFRDTDLTLDVQGSVALEGQVGGEVGLTVPNLWDGRLVALIEADFGIDPQKEFFGVGNNNVGKNELSTHKERRGQLLLTLGGRPIEKLTLAVTGGFIDTDISHGDTDDEPSTRFRFPNLPGNGGGRTSPIGFSVVYNDRGSITRPTRGWTLAAKVLHVNEALGNDFEHTRYIMDLSYLLPLITRRQVLGLRVSGEYIDGPRGEIPFFELSSLGGSRDLRGFFLDRFLGTSRLFGNVEYRLKVFDFNFFDIWQVKIDGVAFGDGGRVFIDRDDVETEFGIDRGEIRGLTNNWQYSYGGGTRIALGEALIARIDVGFSEEESALVYLTFGQTF